MTFDPLAEYDDPFDEYYFNRVVISGDAATYKEYKVEKDALRQAWHASDKNAEQRTIKRVVEILENMKNDNDQCALTAIDVIKKEFNYE
jgi:hypothetical protein